MKLMIVAAVLAACGGTSAVAAEVVVVRDHAAVSGCEALGEVRGASMMGGLLTNAGYEKAIRLLKQRAAALGGTHVQIIDSASGFSGSRMLGTAYRCPVPTAVNVNSARPIS